MKRYIPRLLVAYALSMTMLAAWLGCRAYVYGRMLGGMTTTTTVDHAQIVANWNAPAYLTGPIDRPALLFAALEPTNLAGAAFVIFLASLALAPRRRTPPTNPNPRED